MATKEIMDILPVSIKKEVESLSFLDKLQELRIKVNKPLFLVSNNKEHMTKYICNLEDVKVILQRISSYSIYAFEDEIKQGYITIRGGHRVGICGSCVIEKNSVKTIKNIASINIRIAREVKGCSKNILPYLISENRVLNTIIISPPKCGKTTILRDLAKNISDGVESLSLSGKNVSVIDERSEIGSCYRGVPQMDIGIRTDILDNCPKSEGIIMAIRSMAPQVVVCDEIGTYFEGSKKTLQSKKYWLAYNSNPKGKVIIDDGAKEALVTKRKSLLPAGIQSVHGTFNNGEIISVIDSTGLEIARGITNYNSFDINLIKGCNSSLIKENLGYKNYDEVIHANNLVIINDNYTYEKEE